MPELPEVEVVVRGLRRAVVGRTIASAEVKAPKIVGGLASFGQKVKGQKITNVERRGKMIIFTLSGGGYLVAHMKLTGQFVFVGPGGQRRAGGHSQGAYNQPLPHKHTHVIFTFTDGSHLYYNDLRKFGWVKIASKSELPHFQEDVGPDFLSRDFNAGEFIKSAVRRRTAIFNVLLNQKIASGLGNIYVNETLWRAKVNPRISASKISRQQWQKIVAESKSILKKAIHYGGTSDNTFVKVSGERGGFQNYLNVYHRVGQPCPRRDGGKVTRTKIGSRSAFYCPVCQRLSIAMAGRPICQK